MDVPAFADRTVQGDQRRVSELRAAGRAPRRSSGWSATDSGSTAACGRNSAAARLAGLRDARRGLGLRALARHASAHARRNSIAPPAAPPSRANLDFRRWDPIPVDEGAPGIQQMVGNGWEWTSTVFAPFPGFEPFPFYRNYSEPFFDGQHYVLKGASPRTAACFLRQFVPNWFRPSYPYIYATFRLVES